MGYRRGGDLGYTFTANYTLRKEVGCAVVCGAYVGATLRIRASGRDVSQLGRGGMSKVRN